MSSAPAFFGGGALVPLSLHIKEQRPNAAVQNVVSSVRSA